MITRRHLATAAGLSTLLTAVLCVPAALAQAAATADAVQKTPQTVAPAAPKMPANDGQEIDRVIAIVGPDLILDSDVDEERRFAAFQPFSVRGADFTRERAVERLINRALILQQAKLTPMDPITDADVKKDLDGLRKSIPECRTDHCETDAGWQKFLAAHGFTEADLLDRWRTRMIVLAFIEERFRAGVRISDADIKDYYTKTLLPEYAAQHQTPPKLETIHDKIQEVLLQQQVSNLLSDWLKSLRAQGAVVILKPGEVAP